MTVTPEAIIEAKQAESAQTTQYVSDLVRTIIDKMTATNTTANNVTFSVNLVASGGSPSASNRVISVRTIAPGETYPCSEVLGHVLAQGDFISTLAGTASAITIRASGRKIT